MRSLKPSTFLRRALLLFLLSVLLLPILPANPSPLPPDASSLLSFKSAADPRNNLRFPTRRNFSHCAWRGVQCGVLHGRVVRVVLEGLHLAGVFPPDTLTRLDQLRVLSLRNNSLTGPIPDLSGLVNLKALFLHHNRFSASVPPSISSLHRLRTLDLSFNILSGTLLPAALDKLDRLIYLRLDFNRFNGSVPPFDQPSLRTFNVSGNNFTGAVPVTPALVRFGASCFSLNPGLCGEIVKKECRASAVPFFGNSALAPPPPAVVLGQSAQAQNSGVVGVKPPQAEKRKRIAVVIGFSVGVLLLITTSILIIMVAIKSQKRKKKEKKETTQIMAGDIAAAADAAMVMRMEAENELEEKVKELQSLQMGRSGNLVFCAGEAQSYSLEQLMRASAEMLGRGKVGTTYKAVLDNRLIVCVKRLDSMKLRGTGREGFERHMDSVGGLRHPNLVPLRAYFQAGEERLLVYDYQPNGSLFSLIHGSKSSRAKPLHWTSCLKIAEDVAQGLSYIHQAWRLVHGNLTSSNVLLGPDFEACLSDYCLSVLLSKPNFPYEEDDQVCDPDSKSYEAPEVSRKSTPEFTAKSDVYSFGVLLLELITGKIPSLHPPRMTMHPEDLIKWGRCTRTSAGDDDANTADDRDQEINRLEMLLEVSVACSATSPEQRPTMWQVLKMIQAIKEAAVMEDLDSLVDPPPTESPEPR